MQCAPLTRAQHRRPPSRRADRHPGSKIQPPTRPAATTTTPTLFLTHLALVPRAQLAASPFQARKCAGRRQRCCKNRCGETDCDEQPLGWAVELVRRWCNALIVEFGCGCSRAFGGNVGRETATHRRMRRPPEFLPVASAAHIAGARARNAQEGSLREDCLESLHMCV